MRKNSYITEQYQVAHCNEKVNRFPLWHLLECLLTLLRGVVYFISPALHFITHIFRDVGDNKHPEQLDSFLLLAKFFVLYFSTMPILHFPSFSSA